MLVAYCESPSISAGILRVNGFRSESSWPRYRLDLLIVDEIGYGRFSELGTQLLFEVLRAGYERMSLVITTTVSPDKWGEAFRNEYIAQAAADRLTDRGHLLEATGEPYWKPGRNAVVSPQFRVQDGNPFS